MTTYVLIYSKLCNYCSSFIEKLYKSSMNDKVTQVDINSIPRNKLPKEVTVVPCIIISEPKQFLLGKECFTWLDRFKVTLNELEDFYSGPPELDNYASIDNDYRSPGPSNSIGFCNLNNFDERIYTSNETEASTSETSDFERIQKMRAEDETAIKTQMGMPKRF